MQRSKLKFTVNETVKFSKSSFSCNGAVPPPSTKFGSVKGTSKDYDEGIVEVCVFTSFLCYITLFDRIRHIWWHNIQWTIGMDCK